MIEITVYLCFFSFLIGGLICGMIFHAVGRVHGIREVEHVLDDPRLFERLRRTADEGDRIPDVDYETYLGRQESI